MAPLDAVRAVGGQDGRHAAQDFRTARRAVQKGRTPGGPRVPPAACWLPLQMMVCGFCFYRSCRLRRQALVELRLDGIQGSDQASALPQKFRSAQIGYLLIVAGKNRLDGFFD
jgi:hypothetical protein